MEKIKFTTMPLFVERRTQPFIVKLTVVVILTLSAIGHGSAQGSGTSTNAINITEFSFTPSTIDTTGKSQTVTVTVRVTDSERDFLNMEVVFRSPRIGYSFWFGIQDRISGDGRDGVYRKALTISRYAEAGIWEVDTILIYDEISSSYYRWRKFYTSDLIARGFPTQLQVINNNETVPPEIRDFNFTPSAINTTNVSRNITITLRARDEASGVSSISVSFSNPPGCYIYDDDCVTFAVSITSADRISGDEHDGIYRVVLTVPQSSPFLTYYAIVAATDSVDNYTYLSPTDLAALGYPSELRNFKITPFDFDGDGRADVSVFRPSDRTWYLNATQAGFSATQFGFSTDRLAPADFDGDGKTDIAVYRDGTWYWLNSSNGSFNQIQFGLTNDIPVPSDFSGDGRAELAVYRNGTWWTFNLANNQVNAILFGLSTDRPVDADYDGDGRADQAIYRGNGEWHLNRSSLGYTIIQFGLSTDKPVVSDYDGDGKADAAVYRDGTWYLLQSTQGYMRVQWGLSTDIPAPADFDGDGRTDSAVYRNGLWWVLKSTNGFSILQFGLSNDKPVPAAFLP